MSYALDTSEVRALAADMKAAPNVLAKNVRAVVHKGANNIKNQMRDEMSSSEHFGGVARFISYDMHGGSIFGTAVIEAEIGPRAEGAGLLENIAYFGTSRGGGTIADPQGALDAEMPKYVSALEELMGDLL